MGLTHTVTKLCLLQASKHANKQASKQAGTAQLGAQVDSSKYRFCHTNAVTDDVAKLYFPAASGCLTHAA